MNKNLPLNLGDMVLSKVEQLENREIRYRYIMLGDVSAISNTQWDNYKEYKQEKSEKGNVIPVAKWVDGFEFIPRYDSSKEAIKITGLTQRQRIAFFAVCKYLKEGKADEHRPRDVELQPWSRLCFCRLHKSILGGFSSISRPRLLSPVSEIKEKQGTSPMLFTHKTRMDFLNGAYFDRRLFRCNIFEGNDVTEHRAVVQGRSLVEEGISVSPHRERIPALEEIARGEVLPPAGIGEGIASPGLDEVEEMVGRYAAAIVSDIVGRIVVHVVGVGMGKLVIVGFGPDEVEIGDVGAVPEVVVARVLP